MKRKSILLLALLAGCTLGNSAEPKAMSNTNQTEVATFGGGCFWCIEALFQMLPGVKSVESGYSGGTKENPTYKEVCTGDTGHAEVVQVTFDPAKLSYEKLLETFFEVHDPTTLNRQGADHGTQYRSIILYRNETQKAGAEKAKTEAQKNYKDPIVTQIVPFTKFYKAENYHQDYYRLNGHQPYCQMVIRPKVEKFEKKLKTEEK
jgi:peptide-methionine (S)-S-oxide reductase